MNKNRVRMLAITITSAAAVLFTAGCEYGGSAQQPANDNANSGQSKSDTLATVNLAKSDSLGSIVTDSAGLTLYRFDKDTAKPSKSNCEAKCAEAWPPVLVTGKATVQGVEESLVGTVKRADGAEQLTLAGWPLYRFQQDTKAGDVKGQGVQGTWFAAAPDGKKAQAGAGAGAGAGKPEEQVALKAVKSDSLGSIVTDSKGLTLYRFDKDTAKPSKSNCEAKCAEAWPPALVNGMSMVKGVDQSLVGTVKRADGSEQLTLAGWPLYRFQQDTKPGDLKGQGVQGTWFVSAPDGKKAQAPAAAPANSGGYTY